MAAIEMPPYVLSRNFDLMHAQQLSPTGEYGFIQTLDRTAPFWMAQYNTGSLNETRWRAWTNFFDMLSGSRNTFLAYDPRRPMPLAYASQPLGNDPWTQTGFLAPRINAFDFTNSQITLTQLQNGATISVGDYISANVSGVWYLYRSQTNIPSVTGNSAVLTVKPRPNMPSIPSNAEIIVNGTFTTVTTPWVAGANTTLSIVAGRLRITNNAGEGLVSQAFTTVPGATYSYSVDVVPGTASAFVMVGLGAVQSQLLFVSSATAQTLTGTFTAPATSTTITLLTNTSTNGQFCDFNNVSVKQLAAVRYRQSCMEMKIVGKVTETDPGPSGFPSYQFQAGQYTARVPA